MRPLASKAPVTKSEKEMTYFQKSRRRRFTGESVGGAGIRVKNPKTSPAGGRSGGPGLRGLKQQGPAPLHASYRFEVEGSYAPARSSRWVGASSVAGSPSTRV